MPSIFDIDLVILIKIAALVLLVIYIVFAWVIVRQVKLMTSTLHLGFETPVRLLSYVHLAFAILVFIAAFVLL